MCRPGLLMRIVICLLLLAAAPQYTSALAGDRDAGWQEALRRADAFRESNTLDSAFHYGLRALRTAESLYGPVDTSVALVTHRLGLLYCGTYPDTGEVFFQRAESIWSAVPVCNPLSHARTLNNLGILKQRKGLLNEAEALFLKSLELKSDFLGPDSPDLAITYMNLGILNIDRGFYGDADWAMQRAFDCWNDSAAAAAHVYYLNRSVLLINQFRFPEAEVAASAALRDARTINHGGATVRALDNLITLNERLDRLDSAATLLSEASRICDSLLEVVPDAFLRSQQVALTLVGARIDRRRQDFKGAQELLARADSLAEAYLPPHAPEKFTSLREHAALSFESKEVERSLSDYARAIEYGERVLGARHPELAIAYTGKARAALALGNLDVAVASAEQAAAILYGNLPSLTATVPEQDALRYAAELTDAVGLMLRILEQMPDAEATTVRNAVDIVLRTKGITTDVLLARHREVRRDSDPALMKAMEHRRFVAKKLTDAVLVGHPDTDTLDYRILIDSLTMEYQAASDALSNKDPSFARRADLWAVDANTVQGTLADSTLALEYYAFPGDDSAGVYHYALIAISREEARLFWLPDPDSLAELISRYRAHMASCASLGRYPGRRDLDEFHQIAREIYRHVLGPLIPELNGIRTIHISPAGPLSFISFGSLCNPAGRYLVEEHEIYTLDALRQVAHGDDIAAKGYGVLAIADPDFDSAAEGISATVGSTPPPPGRSGPSMAVRGGCGRSLESIITPIPATRAEVEMIKSQWADSDESVTTLYGPGASETNLKHLATGQRVVHLATHGFALQGDCESDAISPKNGATQDPAAISSLLTSGLLLAGARRSLSSPETAADEDGILSALEVVDLDLTGVQVVTLSSCESGLGSLLGAEGFYGLRTAFGFAGADAVLASLWRVPDEFTSEMLPGIYAGKDMPVSLSLRNAQLQAISRLRSMGLAEHPYLWASFVAYASRASNTEHN